MNRLRQNARRPVLLPEGASEFADGSAEVPVSIEAYEHLAAHRHPDESLSECLIRLIEIGERGTC
jgi:hypothetical protein